MNRLAIESPKCKPVLLSLFAHLVSRRIRLKMVQDQVAELEAKLAKLTAELNAANADKQEVRVEYTMGFSCCCGCPYSHGASSLSYRSAPRGLQVSEVCERDSPLCCAEI